MVLGMGLIGGTVGAFIVMPPLPDQAFSVGCCLGIWVTYQYSRWFFSIIIGISVKFLKSHPDS